MLVTSPTTIESLNEKLLARIFVRLPMPDLMHTELVCKQWKKGHDLACESKRQLSLYVASYRRELEDIGRLWYSFGTDCFPGTQEFKDTALMVVNPRMPLFLGKSPKDFTMKNAQAVTNKFPNVTRLFIYGLNLKQFAVFALMLKKWPNLEVLAYLLGEMKTPFEMFAAESDSEDEKIPEGGHSCRGVWKLLWASLEKLKSLRHLALDFAQISLYGMFAARILPRLESLLISNGCCDANGKGVQKLFRNLPPGLTRLALTRMDKSGSNPMDDDDFPVYRGEGDPDSDDEGGYYNLNLLLTRVKEETFRQLTHFTWHGCSEIDCGGVDLPILNFISTKFTSITSLDLNFNPDISLCQVLPYLRKLSSTLVSIRLSQQQIIPRNKVDVPVSDYEESDEEEENMIINDRHYSHLYDKCYGFGLFYGLTRENYRRKLGSPQLGSIKSLHLANLNLFRWELLEQYFAYAFPGVEAIHFDQCRFSLKRKIESPKVSRAKTLIEAMKKFKNLKTIHRNGSLLADLTVELPQEEMMFKMANELLRKTKMVSFFQFEMDLATAKVVVDDEMVSGTFDLDEYCRMHMYMNGHKEDFDLNYGLDEINWDVPLYDNN